jgi:GGDEF domain-containing protein
VPHKKEINLNKNNPSSLTAQRVSSSHAILCCQTNEDQPLTEAFNEADRLMYEEKRDKK